MAVLKRRRNDTVRVCFWRSDKPRERILADAFLQGVRSFGDEGFELPLRWEIPEELPECDLACMVGVKARRRIQAHWNAGIHTLMMDKGYIRTEIEPMGVWKYWRVAIDGHHPTKYLPLMNSPSDRWEALGLNWLPWREEGVHTVFAGSSEKYHEFYGLDHPTDYARKQIKRIGKLRNGWIAYRPKPSWGEAVPIEGSEFCPDGKIDKYLRNCWALVTHGSNAVFEAMLHGIPSIVLGDAVSRHVSSTNIEDLVNPYLATEEERFSLFSNLAYCQWTMAEFQSGEAWASIRKELIRQCA